MTSPTKDLVRIQCTPIELRAAASGGGSVMDGHFAVFNTWTEIHSYWEGDFLERIAPGAFDATFVERAKQIRVLYDHGNDPSIGNKPLGTPDVMRADDTGAYYEVGLFDAPYVNDLKPALRAGQLGASFRFNVDGESWVQPKEATDYNPSKLVERTITAVTLYEFGPVTFGAYAEATAGLRSGTDQFHDRLLNDPLFIARFTERVGLPSAEKVLTTGTASGLPVSLRGADSVALTEATGRLVAAANHDVLTTRKR